jgi:hypothetical protein
LAFNIRCSFGNDNLTTIPEVVALFPYLPNASGKRSGKIFSFGGYAGILLRII